VMRRGRREERERGARGSGRPSLDLAGEDGFVFKTVIVLALVLAIIGVAALDTVSILSTRYRVSDIADKASFEAADAYKRTGDARQACATAVALVEENVAGATVSGKKGCIVDPATGEVTVTVHQTASTFAAKRLSFLEDLTKVVGKSSSPAPP
jgi:Tfp pilus assembly protein PilX